MMIPEEISYDEKSARALISVVWVKQEKLSFYHWYPNRLQKKRTQFSKKEVLHLEKVGEGITEGN